MQTNNVSSFIYTYIWYLSIALLYTPANEHFGIVPIESMYLECPVIAISSGGPKETVSDGITGYLTPQVSLRISRFVYSLTYHYAFCYVLIRINLSMHQLF